MLRFSTAVIYNFQEKNLLHGIEKSISTPILQEQEKDEGFDCFSDTVSEPDRFQERSGTQFVKNPFKLKRKGSKTSRRVKEMDASDPPTPNVSDNSLAVQGRTAPASVGEMLERPVALSARLR